jgi:hypothetical protein
MANTKIVLEATIKYLAGTDIDELNKLMEGDNWERIELETGTTYYKQVIEDKKELTYETDSNTTGNWNG